MNSNKRLRASRLAFGAAIIALLPGVAYAETEAAAESETEAKEPIVVTGTLIRGAEAVGSQQISVGVEEIATIGASSSSSLLAALPQNVSFLTLPAVQGYANTRVTVNRPRLRFLGQSDSSTGNASTLLLLDGHRLPGMGVRQTSPDMDAIAIGAIERVETVTEGGSATYGSDAIGGVVNLISRRRFDGVDVKAHYGFADDYYTWDADVTVGKDWGWGSAYISYNYAKNDGLFGSDRDYSQRLDWVNNVLGDVACAAPTIVANGLSYAYPSTTPSLGNRCDNTEYRSLFPSSERHTVFGSILFDDGGPVSVSLKGFYMHRESESDAGPLVTQMTVRNTSPFFVPLGAATSETVLLSLSPVFGNSTPQDNFTETYGATINARFDLGSNWQLNAMANTGHGTAEFTTQILNPVTLPTGAAFGTFNPFNLPAAGNAAALAAAHDYYLYGRTAQWIMNLRVIADGTLFTLPGGDAKLAIGAEYIEEHVDANIVDGSAATIASRAHAREKRNIKSLFAELNVPVFRTDAGMGLTLNGSVRHDKYSDFGSTTNPKFGASLALTDWLKLRANWGTSFQAPSLVDRPSINIPTLINLQSVRFPNPAVAPLPGQTQVFLSGVIPSLMPATAKTYSFGFDVKPSTIPGLSLSATYYHVDLKDQISISPVSNPSVFYPLFPDLYFQAPTAAQVAAFAAQATNPTVLTSLPLANIYNINDGRIRNLARVINSGIDFNARYRAETGFGAITAGVAGTYLLSYKNAARTGVALTELVSTQPRLRTAVNLGAEIGNFEANVIWNRASSFAVTPSVQNLQQSRVGAFNVVNFYAAYNFGGAGAFKDLSLTVNVDNVFDQSPPLFRGSYDSTLDGFAGGSTVGRLVKFGIAKKF